MRLIGKTKKEKEKKKQDIIHHTHRIEQYNAVQLARKQTKSM
jgi:hypothetical protein